MAQIHPYLTFNGNCEQAFMHYKFVFGTEFADINRFNEIPSEEETKMTPEEGNKIMHVVLPIGGGTLLFGSDTGGEWAQHFKEGNNISISVNTESEAEAIRIFNGLAQGGMVTMPLAKTFWNAFFGMCTDAFGINWMVNYDYPKEV